MRFLRDGVGGLLSTLRRHHFVRSVSVLLGGTALGQAALLIASPIVTRLYLPAEYGTLAAFAAVLLLLLPVGALRYELTIPLADSDEEAAGMVAVSFASLLGMVALATVLVWVFGEALAFWTDAPGLGSLLWLVPVGLALGGIYHVLNHWAIRRKQFGVISRSEIGRPVTKAVTQVALGLWGAGAVGLVVGEVTGRLGGILPLAREARRDLRPHMPAMSRRLLRGLSRRYWRFPVLTGTGTLLGGAAGHLPALLVAGLYGPQAAGWLGLVQRVISGPSSFLGTAVGRVYLGRAGSLAGREPQALRQLFLRTALLLFAVGAIPTVVLLVAGPALFSFAFGDNWHEAGTYARFLSLMFLGQFVLTPLSNTLDLLRRQTVKLLWDAARLAVVLVTLLVPSWLGEDAGVAIGMYGTGIAILYFGLFLLTLYGLRETDGTAPP